ncbi:PQQ-like beta-propeller repeat protein [Pseudenhygromyxa sp. WMMC2535]|uniref:PQQ-like beta-propeller repeat protein n=1 Tax=Pseudenhygromyxa sp. WMMC2535 TaxID=2712867 RepID=UPI001557FF10|nr:PQQ-like beta-propeller repeat protein [Pseudenhygromyxa sp. WMMC2535]NVB39787.1 PQQ-like beta-propeller repeat protein [Pseudenhygromyxa sp. WMMC2535]
MTKTDLFTHAPTCALAALIALTGCSDDAAGTEGDGGTDTGSTSGGDEIDSESGSVDESGSADESDSSDESDTGEAETPCSLRWEALAMKTNGQTHAAYDVDIADDGTIVTVGLVGNDDNDAWIAVYDAEGELVWEETIDSGMGNDYAEGVAFDAEGDVVFVGSKASAADKELWIERRSVADGSVIWSMSEPSDHGDNEPGDIALAPDGALLVAAGVYAAAQDRDIQLRKIAVADGSELWTSSYSGELDANGYSIDQVTQLAVAPDGTAYVAGSQAVDYQTREGVLVAFGPDGGEPSWAVSPRASGSAHTHYGTVAAAGPENEGYFVIRQTGANPRSWIYRVSADGQVEWELEDELFEFAPTSNWIFAGLDVAEDDSLTISGRLTNEEVGQSLDWSEVFVANFSRAGEGECMETHTWDNDRIVPASSYGYGMAEGPDGAVVVGEVINGPENYLYIAAFK